ncbi:MAG: 3-phosphoshikimate 1-carboxyvinyltransferase [Gemmataceae bacterium]
MSDRLEIVPLTKPPRATVRVPGSKSITNRALVLAAFGSQHGPCTLQEALRSEDTEVMIDSLQRLGFDVQAGWWDSAEPCIKVGHHHGSLVPAAEADLFVANSGTSMRFLTAMVAAGRGCYRLDGIPRMRERPIADLLDALRQLGVRANSLNGNGCPPVVIETEGLQGGNARIRGEISSQFLSGLLMAAPFARHPITLAVEGRLVSRPYVEMTIRQMSWWGLEVGRPTPTTFQVRPQTPKQPKWEMIEADASAASYFFAAAAITGGSVTVDGYLPPGITLQGDIEFLHVLEWMGCRIERDLLWNIVRGGALRGIDVDMNDISDTVMTLAAVACFAEGPTTIRNVAHIRHKETDRLAALATELRRVGAEVAEFADGLTITPRSLHGAEIETYNDHRMAMSMALIGLRVPGIVIKNPGCVGKTYPGFFNDLERLREDNSPPHEGEKS